MTFVRKSCAVLAAAALMVLALAAPASAGSWQSSFAEWTIGNKSRTWSDSGSPANSTVLSIKNCTYSSDVRQQWITFQLHRDDTWTPDENYELRGVDCWRNSGIHTGSWGNKGKGAFYWTIWSVCGYRNLMYATTSYVAMTF